MAGWALQMVKMFYDKPHMVRYTGKDGEIMHNEITSDLIEDGLVVNVKANSVDKQTRRSDAMALVQAKSIDPQTLYEDLDVDNPKERTRRLLAFTTGANDGYSAYMSEIEGDVDSSKPAQGEQLMTAEQATTDLQSILSGQQVQPTGTPDESYVQVFSDFVNSLEFDNLNSDIRQAILMYIQSLQQLVNEKVGGDGQQATPQTPVGQPTQEPQTAFGQPTEQAPVF